MRTDDRSVTATQREAPTPGTLGDTPCCAAIIGNDRNRPLPPYMAVRTDRLGPLGGNGAGALRPGDVEIGVLGEAAVEFEDHHAVREGP